MLYLQLAEIARPAVGLLNLDDASTLTGTYRYRMEKMWLTNPLGLCFIIMESVIKFIIEFTLTIEVVFHPLWHQTLASLDCKPQVG